MQMQRQGLWLSTLSMLLAAGPPTFAQAPPTSGTPHAALTDTQIKEHLEAQGYSNVVVREHDRAKEHVDVTASKNGQTQKLEVNPATGQAKVDTDND